MNPRVVSVSLLPLILVACGSPPPPAAEPAKPAPPASAAAVAPPPAPPAPEPTPEEKKKAEDARQLAADRAAWEEAYKAETARWTPELHAEAKALAEKAYPSGK